MMYGKWLVECLDENGEWNKFNYFTCDLSEVKEKMANILVRTKYQGVKCSLAKDFNRSRKDLKLR